MSVSLYAHRDRNIRKTWVLMFFFLLAVIVIGWVFAQVWGNSLILYAAVILAVLMNFFGYYYSDKVVLGLTGARPASREEFFDLYTITENLAITAGLPMPKIYVIDDPAPNAFATGRDEKHAVVAVTTGILRLLDRTELEGVIAHELSHIGNRDMLVSTVAVVLVGFIAVLSDIFLRSLRGGGALSLKRRHGKIILIATVALAILAPPAATLIRLAISRKREFLADASGALLTRYPEGLARALEKISLDGTALRRVSDATAHLFIVNPFGRVGRPSFHRLFMTHPPIEERVKALRQT